MNHAIICLGSNSGHAADRIASARDLVATLASIEASTTPYRTEPEYAGDAAPYLNMLLQARTPLSLAELESLTKEYQTSVRSADACRPLVAIDIDIVEWNGTVIRPADAASQYYRMGLAALDCSYKPADKQCSEEG